MSFKDTIKGIDRFLAVKTFTAKKRLEFYEKLHAFVADGHSVVAVLKTMKDRHVRNKTSQAIMFGEWLARMESGKTFAKALEGWAPSHELTMLASGEASGREREALEELMTTMEATLENEQVIRASSWAIVGYFVGFMLIALIISLSVAPNIREALPEENWGMTTHTFFNFTDFMVQYGIIIAIGVVAMMIVMWWSFPRWVGSKREFMNRVFPPYAIHQLIEASYFMTTLSGMMSAGIPFQLALMNIRRNGNRYVAHYVRQMEAKVGKGENEAEALMTPFLPKAIADDVIDYGSLSSFDRAVARLGAAARNTAQTRIKILMAVITRILQVLIMGFLAWFFAGVGEVVVNTLNNTRI